MNQAVQDRLETVRANFRAYESGDRALLEKILSDDFCFFAPPDPGIDRATYWHRCWPNSEMTEKFDFLRLIEAGDEVLVTYDLTRTDGSRVRNTEIFSFDGDEISRVEVYFGWDLPAATPSE
jgi:ketosteroid isomerase-like protein